MSGSASGPFLWDMMNPELLKFEKRPPEKEIMKLLTSKTA